MVLPTLPLITYGIMAAACLVLLLVVLWPLMRPREEMPPKVRWRMVIALVLLVPVASAYGYHHVGGHQQGFMGWHGWLALKKKEKNIIHDIKNSPQDVDNYIAMADIEKQKGDYDAATKTLRNAVLISEGNPLLITMYGEALTLRAKGQVTPQALEAFEMAIKLVPDLPQARYYVGMHHMQQGDAEQALAIWQALREELPDEHPVVQHLNQMRQTVRGE